MRRTPAPDTLVHMNTISWEDFEKIEFRVGTI